MATNSFYTKKILKGDKKIEFSDDFSLGIVYNDPLFIINILIAGGSNASVCITKEQAPEIAEFILEKCGY